MTQHIVVVGAGIAGASCAWVLANRGYRITVLDAASKPGSGGSGNPLAIVYPAVIGLFAYFGAAATAAICRAFSANRRALA